MLRIITCFVALFSRQWSIEKIWKYSKNFFFPSSCLQIAQKKRKVEVEILTDCLFLCRERENRRSMRSDDFYELARDDIIFRGDPLSLHLGFVEKSPKQIQYFDSFWNLERGRNFFWSTWCFRIENFTVTMHFIYLLYFFALPPLSKSDLISTFFHLRGKKKKFSLWMEI